MAKYSCSKNRVRIPAGRPPISPNLQKKKYSFQTEIDFKNWAIAVYEHFKGEYMPEAIAYWLFYYMDVTHPKFQRIRKVILESLELHEKSKKNLD